MYYTPQSMKLVLASKSQGRKHMFDGLGIDYEICTSDVDESKAKAGITDPTELAIRLAELKAEAVAKNYDDAIVVGGDTVGDFEGQLIGKAKDREHARQMLKEMSGKTHKFISAFCIINTKTGEKRTGSGEIEMFFRELSDREINRFIQTDLPMQVCGGYDVRHNISQLFIEKVSGSYNSLIGLPMELIIPILKEMDLDI